MVEEEAAVVAVEEEVLGMHAATETLDQETRIGFRADLSRQTRSCEWS